MFKHSSPPPPPPVTVDPGGGGGGDYHCNLLRLQPNTRFYLGTISLGLYYNTEKTCFLKGWEEQGLSGSIFLRKPPSSEFIRVLV